MSQWIKAIDSTNQANEDANAQVAIDELRVSLEKSYPVALGDDDVVDETLTSPEVMSQELLEGRRFVASSEYAVKKAALDAKTAKVCESRTFALDSQPSQQ